MKILVATKALPVFDVLQGIEGIECQEALFTGQIYDALPEVQLVIVDFEDLVQHPYSVEMLQSLLAESGVPSISSEEFLAQPDKWLREARRMTGEMTRLPEKMSIAFVSYSGGTGKTTLALDTALHFARRTKMPVLLVEFTYGESAIAALTGLEMPYLFDLTTQLEAKAMRWKGVTLAPMDYDNCQDLSIQLIAKYLKGQMAQHVLTVIDSRWPHGLIGAIRDEVDRWFVVTTPRPDAIENAKKLKKELGPKASIILNQKGGIVDSLALTGLERALDLPQIRQVDRFEGHLGRRILSQAYGPQNWRRYEPQSLIARIGRRFGFGRGGH